jgi:hypothetical protein
LLVFVIGVAGLLLIGCWSVRYLASPRWEVWVTDESGNPLADINVRLSYQNYSAEAQSHEITQRTDQSGHAVFQPQFEKASLWQRLYYTGSAATAFVHASFGRHAYVFAFGDGYEGSALNGEYVTDWTGKPDTMQSRIVAKPIRQRVQVR